LDIKAVLAAGLSVALGILPAMQRVARLLQLMQLLRRHRRAVTGEVIARELGVSLRTLYRDIATLQQQGAAIDGAPGLGYLLRPGFVLPPLMFSEDEIEALVLGTRWVGERGDSRLALAARDAIAKIAAVLPPPLRRELESSALLVGPGAASDAEDQTVAAVREAIRKELKLAIDYRSAEGTRSQRTVWPFALGFFDRVRVVVAWCEQRQAIRHFRADRIEAHSTLAERYPERRQVLLGRWRVQEGVAEP
jgi:predicted DNA-binding transcriptional regulator YafY